MFEGKLSARVSINNYERQAPTSGFVAGLRNFFKKEHKAPLRQTLHKIFQVLEEAAIRETFAAKIGDSTLRVNKIMENDEVYSFLANRIGDCKSLCLLLGSKSENQLITYDICLKVVSDSQADITVIISGIEQLPTDFRDSVSYAKEIKQLSENGFWGNCEKNFKVAVSTFISRFHEHFNIKPVPTTHKVVVVDNAPPCRPRKRKPSPYSGRYFYAPSTCGRYYDILFFGDSDFYLFYYLNCMNNQWPTQSDLPVIFIDAAGKEISSVSAEAMQAETLERAPEIESGIRESGIIDHETPDTGVHRIDNDLRVDNDPNFEVGNIVQAATAETTIVTTPAACACETPVAHACDCTSACDCACACACGSD